MRITKLRIRNYKSIEDLTLKNLEDAVILVGKNSTGKTVVLDAIRVVNGAFTIDIEDFRDPMQPVRMDVELAITEDDLQELHRLGKVSKYRRYEVWLPDFCKKLPSYKDGVLKFQFAVSPHGDTAYIDGISRKRSNEYIKEVFPKVYYLDTQRDLEQFQKDLLLWMENDLIKQMRSGSCMFDEAKECRHCYDCIGLMEQKAVTELSAFETAKLLEYKLHHVNLDDFEKRLNANFRTNGGKEEIRYTMNRNIDQMLQVTTEMYNPTLNMVRPIEKMPKGMRSVYTLSLLETYAEGDSFNAGIIMVEETETFLHPQMQKEAGEILYRLSKKNQVLFSTHSPNLLLNFNSKQIRQMVLDEEGRSRVREKTDTSQILEDLGYSAGDLMNVNFVFIVEGKQDRSRLPILLKKYYAETVDPDGGLNRIAIINTNSCTNIKTYANLKYINQLYLKDQFLMIRDSDGKDPKELKSELCGYYESRRWEDTGAIPRITPENVLILRYYSFENYFFNPKVMAQIGVVKSEDEFYRLFLRKWKDHLSKISSGRRLREVLGKDLRTTEDVKEHMEEIRIYMRGHNLFDAFYGRYRGHENEILTKYVEAAPREDYADILEPIDRFIYFENRKR